VGDDIFVTNVEYLAGWWAANAILINCQIGTVTETWRPSIWLATATVVIFRTAPGD
jgi:enolase